MADVTIGRCVIRVVRRGGWSWGREPRQLVNDVVRVLPMLLAAELQRLVPDEAEGELAAPVRLDVRVSLSELRTWARALARQIEAGGEQSRDGIGAADASLTGADGLPAALRRVLASAHVLQRISLTSTQPIQPRPSTAAGDARHRATTVLNVLLAWFSAGALESLLRALPDAAVNAWHRVLHGTRRADDAVAQEERLPEMRDVLTPYAALAVDATPAERVRLRLLAAAEIAASGGEAPERSVRAAIDAAIPDAEDDVSLGPGALPVVHETPALRAGIGFETRVPSALPFLLLGPLHRIGWLDVLDATLAGAHLDRGLPALAIALATKVLPEPERGWRRTPDAIRASATFAGDTGARPDDEIASLAHAAAPLMPALDAVLRRALLDGRRSGNAVLLCSTEALRLIVDPPGVFLIAHAHSDEELAGYLVDARAPVFVPDVEADARMLEALDRAGVAFVTPARPVRGEQWTALSGTRAPRLFSNRRVAGFALPPDEAWARARQTWEALARRPIPGHPSDPSLDRTLSLAAALALCTIAWELWRSREATDALLALERFGDLEGTVRFDEAQVRVRLPLGKRFRDLEAAGLLAEIPRLPWLGFRSVVFAGG